MKNRPDKGYALILVIMGIVVVGMIMTLLAHDSNTLLFETEKALCKAVDRNLAQSGLAWARLRGSGAGEEMTELDVNDLAGPTASLHVTIEDINEAPTLVQVRTAYAYMRYRVRESRTYRIAPKDPNDQP